MQSTDRCRSSDQEPAASDMKERGQAMANTVSAKKMTRKIAKRTAINRSRRSRMRTFIRKVGGATATGEQTAAAAAARGAAPGARARRGRSRTFTRRGGGAIAPGDQPVAAAALRAVEPELMRAAQKG